jgi:hypothetical protein
LLADFTGEGDTSADEDTMMGQLEGPEDNDIFMELPHRSPPPSVAHTTQDKDQDMADEQVVGENIPDTHRKDPEDPHGLETTGPTSDQDAGPGDTHPKDTPERRMEIIEPSPARTPPKRSQTGRPTSRPHRGVKSHTIVMSSSDESDEAEEVNEAHKADETDAADAADGESEVSSPPSSPAPTTRKSTRSTAHPQSKDIPDDAAVLHRALGPNFGSKLTLHGSLGSEVSGKLNMVKTPAPPVSESVFSLYNCMVTTFPVQMIKEPFSFQYFSLDPTSEPKTYNFVTHQKVVSDLNVFHLTI